MVKHGFIHASLLTQAGIDMPVFSEISHHPTLPRTSTTFSFCIKAHHSSVHLSSFIYSKQFISTISDLTFSMVIHFLDQIEVESIHASYLSILIT